MAVPFIKTSFAAGEVAPSLFGHVDNVHYALGCSTCRNAFISYRGGAYSRAGTAFVGYSAQTGRGVAPRLIRFSFSVRQGLTLEFGNFYMRVIQNGAFVTESPIAITNIILGNPTTVVAINSYVNGDWVFISGLNTGGPQAIQGQTFKVANRTGTTFQLWDVFNNPIDSTSFSPYTGGGTAARIYTLTTPYAEADLKWLKFDQSANVMSITCWNQDTGTLYPPYDLLRIANNNWTITQVTFAPTVSPPPGSLGLALTHPAGALGASDNSDAVYGFEVTAVNPVDGTESVASTPTSVGGSANIAVTSAAILINWNAVPGVGQYNVYACQSVDGTTASPPPNFIPAGVLYGFVGTSLGTSFTYGNVIPDFAQVPPLHTNPFAPGAIIGGNLSVTGAYSVAPTGVAITTSTGSGAILQPVYDPQSNNVTGIYVVDAGSGYAPGDTFSVTGGTFTTPASGTLIVGPATGTFPGVVSYFQERRVYAATPNQPDTYFMSQPGSFTNFDRRIPTIDSDAITGTPWSQQVNGIQALVSMPGGLIILTGNSAWQLTGVGGSSQNPQPITPANQQAQPQAYNGCHPNIPPIKINWEVFYVQTKGSIIRAWSYNFFVNIYTGLDLTYLSSHLFSATGNINSGGVLREWAWCEEPFKVLWATRSDGTWLSLTYFKEQEVSGWARHDTLGQVWSVSSVTELPVDALYLAVQRFPGGTNSYMIERMDNRLWNGVETAWCVDAGLTLPLPTPNAILSAGASFGNNILFQTNVGGVFSAGNVGNVIRMGGGVALIVSFINSSQVLCNITTPIALRFPDGSPVSQGFGNWTIAPQVTRVTGLNHLRGALVTGVADGVPLAPQAVVTFSDGTVGITLPFPASEVTVGLGFQVQVQSLYLDAGQPTIQGRRKKIAAASVRLEASAGVKVGANQPDGSTFSPGRNAPVWNNLSVVPDKGLTNPTPGGSTVTELFTGDVRVPLSGGYDVHGQVAAQQDNPLPMQILAFIPEVLEGDLPEAAAQRRQQPEQSVRRAA